MTNQLPQIVLPDPNNSNSPWQHTFMGRFYDKEPFASEAGYCRLLVFLNCIERDMASFDNLKAARGRMFTPLMAKKMLRLIRADMAKFNVAPATDYEPLGYLQPRNMYEVIGWLHIIEQMLFLIKATFNIHYWTKRGEFGFDTWCKYTAEEFNFDEYVPYGGETTLHVEVDIEAGAVAAIERIDSLSERML